MCLTALCCVQVEVKAVWLGKKEGQEEKVSARDKMVDKVMGVRKPTYKRPYNPTRLNSSYLYHCISMMMVSTLLTAMSESTV